MAIISCSMRTREGRVGLEAVLEVFEGVEVGMGRRKDWSLQDTGFWGNVKFG